MIDDGEQEPEPTVEDPAPVPTKPKRKRKPKPEVESSGSDPEPQTKEKKVKRETSKVRGGKKRVAAKGTRKEKTVSTRESVTRSRLDPTAKVTKGSGENPFREGSESYARTQVVLKSLGQTVETIRKKDILPTTLANLKKLGVIKIS
jgi:hypothetical protein